MINHKAQLYENAIFRQKIGIERFWVKKEPRHSEDVLAEINAVPLS